MGDAFTDRLADGSRIGRYLLGDVLGRGAMGVVYAARDEMMDREVAVKVMMTDLEDDPETKTRFYREAQAAGRLLHRNIVTMFDLGEDEGRLFMVMERLRGHTLGEFAAHFSVSLEQKVDLMIQACSGLGAAHAAGIVHRDIKPGNLFVQEDGGLKILDFGVARLAGSTLTASGYIIGTPDFMSPEQSRGKEVDGRSDIFSAAAVFYHLLSGRKPFDAEDLPAVIRRVVDEEPAPLCEGEAPEGLWRILARALAKDPLDRYQSFEAMVADLAAFQRRYDADTRRIAVTAAERYRTIDRLVAERQALLRQSGATPVQPPESAVLDGLRTAYPLLQEYGADGLAYAPLTRVQAEAIEARLAAAESALAREVDDLRSSTTERRRPWGDEAGQTTTEWLMIAGVLTAIVVLFMRLFPGALRLFMLGITHTIRTVAP